MPKIKRKTVTAFLALAFITNFLPGIVFGQTSGDINVTELGNDRIELERQLQELEKQISEHQGQIQKYGTEKKSLQNEINSLNARIKKINLEIKAIDLTLEKVNKNIVTTQKSINQTENKIDSHKNAIKKALQIIQETDKQSVVEVMLTYDNFSDFFTSVHNTALVQDNLRLALNEITTLREDLVQHKNQLTEEKINAENIKIAQQNQKRNSELTQVEKANLLKITKGKESEYQTLLKKTQATAAQIRNRIFQLLGGGQLTFEEAYKFSRLAENATGVRSAFILAILNQESKFGRNVGRCKYNEIHPKTGMTVMRPSEITVFETILTKLNIDKESTAAYVSCPIVSDGSYGGAMGPAQFMPSTWKLYEKDIANITGSNPPSPWNNADAFTATALYLKGSLSSGACRNYADQIPSQRQFLLERCAASQYYAGKNWYSYRFAYGDPVANKAQQFQKDIETISS